MSCEGNAWIRKAELDYKWQSTTLKQGQGMLIYSVFLFVIQHLSIYCSEALI